MYGSPDHPRYGGGRSSLTSNIVGNQYQRESCYLKRSQLSQRYQPIMATIHVSHVWVLLSTNMLCVLTGTGHYVFYMLVWALAVCQHVGLMPCVAMVTLYVQMLISTLLMIYV